MISIKKLYLLLLASFFLAFSCHRESVAFVEENSPSIVFHTCPCDTLLLSAGRYENGFNWGSTDGNNLLFLNIAVIPDKTSEIMRDLEIEREITKYLTSRFTGYARIGYPIDICYLQEICSSISITSDISFYSHSPGEEISDLFVFFVKEEYLIDHSFILSGDNKQWVGAIKTGMTIEQYLSYEPYIFPWAVLILTPQSLTLTEGMVLTVQVSLKGGKTLKSSITV